MKTENFEKLSHYEEYFTTAVYADWCRNLPTKYQDELEAIWEEETDYPKLFVSKNCSSCLLHGIKTIGRWYFDEKKIREFQAANSITKEETDRIDDLVKHEQEVRKAKTKQVKKKSKV